ncbi:hypothetical protein Celaphus_00010311, partial [Cervus elaphus hippelaphus]
MGARSSAQDPPSPHAGLRAAQLVPVPMASERRKVKYHWSSTSDRSSRKRSCLREPSDVAPSSRPAHSSVSRSGGASSPKRLKAQKDDDVSWGSSRRKSSTSSSHSRRRSSTSSSSSHSSGP